MGAGLPIQQGGCHLDQQFVFVIYDVLFELCSFGRRHRSEEGLHPFHFRLGWLLVSDAWTISGVVSFLLAFEACSLCVYHVLSRWCVSSSCGTQSTSRRIGH